MSTSSANLQERGSEWRATAEASMTVRILVEAAAEVSTKRFVKSRAARIERWAQLERVAREQINGLSALAKAPAARKVRPKAAVPTAAPERDQGPPLPFEAAVS
jgi:hypothetical protein